MAVTIGLFDLIQPTGELADVLFPDGNMNDLVYGWLDQATSHVTAATGIATADQNYAAAAWVYYRAYDHVAQRLGAIPNVVNISGSADGSTRTFSTDQRKYFRDQSDNWFAKYNSFLAKTDQNAPAVPAFFGRISVS